MAFIDIVIVELFQGGEPCAYRTTVSDTRFKHVKDYANYPSLRVQFNDALDIYRSRGYPLAKAMKEIYLGWYDHVGNARSFIGFAIGMKSSIGPEKCVFTNQMIECTARMMRQEGRVG